MACPTCDHTMTGIRPEVFWCPRCGTIRDTSNGIDDHAKPKLVERCRAFGDTLGPRWFALWVRLGIEESINVPADRRTQPTDLLGAETLSHMEATHAAD